MGKVSRQKATGRAVEQVGAQSTSCKEGQLCCAVAWVILSRGLGMCLFT